MKYELSYDKEHDLIVGRVEGDIDPVLVKKMASEFADIIETSGCHKLLNDLRDAKITPSTLDIYNMPRIISKQGVHLACKRALVVPEASDDFRFLETVSVNVGQQVRIFTDPEAAIEWLSDDHKSPYNFKKVARRTDELPS